MKYTIYLLAMCVIFLISGCSNVPATEIVSEVPDVIGHVVEINNEKQVFAIIENSSKQEALDYNKTATSSNEIWIYMNQTTIDGQFKLGDKVAIWRTLEGPEEIAELIVVIEK